VGTARQHARPHATVSLLQSSMMVLSAGVGLSETTENNQQGIRVERDVRERDARGVLELRRYVCWVRVGENNMRMRSHEAGRSAQPYSQPISLHQYRRHHGRGAKGAKRRHKSSGWWVVWWVSKGHKSLMSKGRQEHALFGATYRREDDPKTGAVAGYRQSTQPRAKGTDLDLPPPGT